MTKIYIFLFVVVFIVYYLNTEVEAKDELRRQKRQFNVNVEHKDEGRGNKKTSVGVGYNKVWESKDKKRQFEAGVNYNREFGREYGRRFDRPNANANFRFKWRF